MRYYRTTGLALTQMQELVRRVKEDIFASRGNEPGGRKSLGLYQAVEAACMYLRQNVTQEFIGDMRECVATRRISRYVAELVPIVKAVLEEFVPSAEEAIGIVRGRVVLVDGTLAPCYVLRGHRELWNKKHKTTGLQRAIDIPSRRDRSLGLPLTLLPGRRMTPGHSRRPRAADILKEAGGGFGDKGYQGTGLVTPKKKPIGGELSLSDKEYDSQVSSFRAPVERLVGHFKNWKILHTDYRRPYSTYHDAFDAARGLFFFSITWGFE